MRAGERPRDVAPLRGRPVSLSPNDPTGVVLARGWLFLAMAHARLGHAAEARQWLEEAAAWMEEPLQRKPWENPLPWDQRLILQRLRREAEALVHSKGPR